MWWFECTSGSEPDFIQNDSYEDHVPVNEDYECDIVQEIRNSYDNKLDFSTAYRWDSSPAAKFQDTLCHPICKKLKDFLEKKPRRCWWSWYSDFRNCEYFR